MNGLGSCESHRVGMGRDHTLFALTEGTVTFRKGLKGRTYISVQAAAPAAE